MKVKGTTNSGHSDCELNDHGVNKDGTRRFFCIQHQQWTYVFPISHTYTYDVESGLPPVTVTLRDI